MSAASDWDGWTLAFVIAWSTRAESPLTSSEPLFCRDKSKLSKGSDDNWSKTLYKIGKVIRKQGTRAERYRLVKKAKVSEDTIYTRNDLQKVDVNTLEKIPTKQKKATRAQVEKDKDESGIGARVRKARRRLFS